MSDNRTDLNVATVLVVDDDAAVLRYLEIILQRAGFEVLTANSPIEAIAAFASGTSIGLVVSDMQMPEMHGTAMVRRLRALTPTLPVIYLSGFTTERPENQHDLFLPKPVPTEQLIAEVRRLMSATTLVH